MTRTKKEKDNQLETSKRVFNYNSNKNEKRQGTKDNHGEVERFQDLFEFHRIAPVVVVPVIHPLEIGKFASDAKS